MAVNFGFNIIGTGLDLVDKIGSGGFGTVYKVIDKLADQVYALKKIDFKDSNSRESVLKEVKTLAKTEGNQVVRYYHSWIQDDCVFIKMEFCSTNLKDLLEQKAKCFGRQTLDPINVLDYYISYQLFKEVIECVQYLHELNPPIIHRDLKPQNILVNYEPVNGRYLKLCDFGLATFHYMESISHSVGVGTFKYRAPEVFNSSKYGSKADIYGLGMIGQDIFGIDINEYHSDSIDTNFYLMSKLTDLSQLIILMIQTLYKNRPTCAEILDQYRHLSINSDELENYPDYPKYIEKIIETNVKTFADYSNRLFTGSSEPFPDLIRTATVNPKTDGNSQAQMLAVGTAPVQLEDEDQVDRAKKIVDDVKNIRDRLKLFFDGL